MNNKLKHVFSILVVGFTLALFINVNYSGETANASDPNECCLNGYGLWDSEGPYGFSDCNCNTQTGDPAYECSCPKEPQVSN